MVLIISADNFLEILATNYEDLFWLGKVALFGYSLWIPFFFPLSFSGFGFGYLIVEFRSFLFA